MKENVDWYRQVKIKSILTQHRLVYEKMFSRIGYVNSKSVKVLLAFFGSQYYYETLKRLHPHFDIYVVDDIHFKFAYTNISEDHIVFINIDECARKNGKGAFFENDANKIFKLKFDYIFINPPYDGNLHLKILSQAIDLLTDDGVCTNLSPIRWLQDPLAEYKSGSDWYKFKNVRTSTKELLTIKKNIASVMFSGDASKTYITMDLGIYIITRKSYDAIKPLFNSIIKKIKSKNIKPWSKFVDAKEMDGWRVRVNKIAPLEATDGRDERTSWWRHWIINPHFETFVYYNGFTKNGKHWSELADNQGKYKKEKTEPLSFSIKFNTENEAFNFEKSCNTIFMNGLKNIMQQDQNVPLSHFPFMGDCINPRTGLKGYESEWTDDDFCKYFGITDDEWNEIVETMKPYLQEIIVEK